MALFTPMAYWANVGSTIITPYTKALSYGGANGRSTQVTNSSTTNPLRMGDIGTTTTSPTSGFTSNDINARPWACAILFRTDQNSTNQHIWNQGEGAGSTDDNIYLRVDASNRLRFGWGRNGSINECYVVTLSSSTRWYAIYVAHNGTRFSSATATASNLAGAFDIRFMTSLDDFNTLSVNQSTAGDWGGSLGSNGARMDRSIAGDFTIGGRGSNRSFHGDIASMVTTTLTRNSQMPNEDEIKNMMIDPIKWINNYKAGQNYRLPADSSNTSGFLNLSITDSSRATQVWLNGDTSGDSATTINNYILTSNTQVRLTNNNASLVNVNIPGLT